MSKNNLEELRKPLSVSDIDFRIQSINNGKYATIIAYKDARVDMNRLDDVIGSMYWKREHFDNNTRCKVSLYNSDIKEWISKEDVGTHSQNEKEKGLASDSFKRACFNWGIGRELYDYPVINIRLKDSEVQETGKQKPKYKASFNLKLKDWVWKSEFKDGKIMHLSCVDNNGAVRFTYPNIVTPTTPTTPVDTKPRDLTRHKTKITNCQTTDDLKKVYTEFTKAEQRLLVKEKDVKKLELSNQGK